MPSFDSDGVEIAFIDEGEGEPLLLIHGFASNVAANWVDPGWVRMLTQSGRRVVAYDNRGHGRSEKLYDPDVYGAPLMAETVGGCSTTSVSCAPMSSAIRWAHA